MSVKKPWHLYYPVGVSPTLNDPNHLLTDLLVQSAEQFPKHPALHFFGRKISYQLLLKKALRFANGLQNIGVQHGMKVAIVLPNCPQYVIGYYGVLFAGATVVSLQPHFNERELSEHLSDSQADTIICLDKLFPQVKKIMEKIHLNNVVITSLSDELPFLKKIMFPLSLKPKYNTSASMKWEPGMHAYSSLIRHTPIDSNHPVIDAEQNIAVIQYSCADSGPPKGVMLTHKNIVANITQCQHWLYKHKPGKEKILAALPLFHVYGMTVCMNYGLAIGAQILLTLDTEELLKVIDKERPTFLPGTPSLYQTILHHPQRDRFNLTSITCCISGYTPLLLKTQQKLEKIIGGKVIEGFGMSEAAITHLNPVWGRRVNGSIGIPWPGTDCKIVDERGETKEIGETGELVIKGPQVMKGYWNRQEETEAILQDGWLYTGDMGYMDHQGYFYVVDRKKEIIQAGGDKVYPREVEDVLCTHPGVREAVVIGAKDEDCSETVTAYIVPNERIQLKEEALIHHCRARLDHYKVPRVYVFREEIPRNLIGRVQRRALIHRKEK